MGPLAQIFSTAEGVKRKLVDALRNPSDAAAQFVGNQADRARNLQGMTAAATDEFVNTGSLRGPAQSRLDQVVADAYNPVGMTSVVSALRGSADDVAKYAMEHRPMTVEGGAARLHDLTPAFGEDIYTPKALQYFGSGDPRERKVLQILQKARQKPDEMVTIYRGVPDNVNAINPGDWVTLLPEYAEDYGRVISMKVPAKQVTSWADSLAEFGYYPD